MRKDHAPTAAQREDARAARALLEASKIGLSLTAAIETLLAMQGKKKSIATTAPQAINVFLPSVMARGRRPATYRFYEEKLKGFSEWAGDRSLDSITRPELKDWLGALSCGPVGKGMVFRAVRALYRWGMKQDPALAHSDPTVGLTLDLPKKAHGIRFLTVDQAERILRGVRRELLPTVALHLFAGIRPEEITPLEGPKPRLQWEHINFAERIICVPAEVSKTGKDRPMEELPEAIWAWLAGFEKKKGPISKTGLRWVLAEVKAAGKFTPKRNPWPHDGFRRTFASYAVALTNNPGKVSLWLGHEGGLTMLHNHYRGKATKAEAERFWALRPAAR